MILTHVSIMYMYKYTCTGLYVYMYMLQAREQVIGLGTNTHNYFLGKELGTSSSSIPISPHYYKIPMAFTGAKNYLSLFDPSIMHNNNDQVLFRLKVRELKCNMYHRQSTIYKDPDKVGQSGSGDSPLVPTLCQMPSCKQIRQ